MSGLILSSWAPKTVSSYNTYKKKWDLFCSRNGIEYPHLATFEEGANFLADLFKSGEKYGSIAAARSALSAILPTREGVTFGKDPTVCRLLKGVFKERPCLPRHTVTYDVNVVLKYIKLSYRLKCTIGDIRGH